MPDVSKTVKLSVPKLAENYTTHEKSVWDYHTGELMKTERVLDDNRCTFSGWLCRYVILMLKKQVESSTKFDDIEKKMDSIGLLCTIKKVVHTGGTSDLKIRHGPHDLNELVPRPISRLLTNI